MAGDGPAHLACRPQRHAHTARWLDRLHRFHRHPGHRILAEIPPREMADHDRPGARSPGQNALAPSRFFTRFPVRSHAASPAMTDKNQLIEDAWDIPEGVTYLNHGSFGPAPRPVREAQARWTAELQRQPMEFFVRRLEGLLDEACAALGQFVGADARDLVLVDNATAGMNIVARSVELQPGDQVLLTDHEYGAVRRLWQKTCQAAGAELIVRRLPWPLLEDDSAEQLVEHLVAACTDRTRLLVASHVTSATATTLPIAAICQAASQRGVPVCVDGPHAVAMLPLAIEQLGCDYYTASCHKWLSAPFGSGFLWVRRRHQPRIRPAITSWGGSVGGRDSSWKDEFTWGGTRDPACWLAIPEAISFLEDHGIESFRDQTHDLVNTARRQLLELTGLQSPLPESRQWYGPMAIVPLPPNPDATTGHGHVDPLQRTLQQQFGIETPVTTLHKHRYIRISCHLYNTAKDIDHLVGALSESLPG
ncbi:MAG TPA: aminotransferase [Planctomycetaceae bacterium]|nr:aminotransferase [Planctomycetaceae bacterium]